MTQPELPLQKPTAKAAILARLREAGRPLACHELHIPCVSENAAATRLSEMARAGLVVGRTRPGKAFKEWTISHPASVKDGVASSTREEAHPGASGPCGAHSDADMALPDARSGRMS